MNKESIKLIEIKNRHQANFLKKYGAELYENGDDKPFGLCNSYYKGYNRKTITFCFIDDEILREAMFIWNNRKKTED